MRDTRGRGATRCPLPAVASSTVCNVATSGQGTSRNLQNDVVRVWPKAWKLRIGTLKNADIDLLPEWAHREACGGSRSPGSRSAIPFVAMAFEEAVMRLDPFAGAYLTDPAQVWRRLLDEPEGVRHDPDLGLWLITRHADVRRALGDAEAFGNALTLAPIYDVCPEAMEFIARIDAPPTTAAADPRRTPDPPGPAGDLRQHRRTRRTPVRRDRRAPGRRTGVPARRPRRRAGGPRRRVHHRTAPAGPARHPRRTGGGRRAGQGLGDGQIALLWGQPDPAEQVRLARDLWEFWRYCERLVGARLGGARYGEDYVSQLLAYRDGDDEVLTVAEVSSIVFNLMVAGHETTAGLLAHALDQALSGPGRWRSLARTRAGYPRS